MTEFTKTAMRHYCRYPRCRSGESTRTDITLQPHSSAEVPAAAYILSEMRKPVLALLAGVAIVALEKLSLKRSNPLAALGRASYSLYALHTPTTFLLLTWGASWYATVAVNLAVAFVAHFAIERPGEMIGRIVTSHLTNGL